MRFIVLAILFILCKSSVHALVQTDTHTYVPGGYNRYVIAVDRQTGQEMKIQTYSCPRKILQHEDKGFVVSFDKVFVEVIDLKMNRALGILKSPEGHTDMEIWKSLGIVYGLQGEGVWIYDLAKDVSQPIYKLDLDRLSAFLLSGNMAYIAHREELVCLNLETLTCTKMPLTFKGKSVECTHIVPYQSNVYLFSDDRSRFYFFNLLTGKIAELSFGSQPRPMIVYGDVGYVPLYGDNKICVLDLKTNTLIKEIETAAGPNEMIAEGKKGYVVERYGQSVLVIDLEHQEIIKRIHSSAILKWIQIHKGFIYLFDGSDSCSAERKNYIYDAETFAFVASVPNERCMPFAFSDTHFYVNGTKALALPVKPKGLLSKITLFGSDYKGIEGDYDGDADEAYTAMMTAVSAGNEVLAVEHFHKAMAYGSRKAYAIAALSFRLGMCGAAQDYNKYLEFYRAADYDLYMELYNIYS